MNHIHVDMDQVEAMIAQSDEAMRKMAELPGEDGAFARLSLTMGTAFSRQLAIEVNRGTTVAEVRFALASTIANALADFRGSALDDEASPAAVMVDQIETLQMIANNLSARAHGKGTKLFEGSVRPTAAGRS